MTAVDRQAIASELQACRRQLHDLLASAGPADLRRRSNGARWTNEQLLFHMVFGFLVVRTLPPLGRFCDRVVGALCRSLDRRSARSLGRGMPFPTSWDPYFTRSMTLADVYRYPTLHFEHHGRQLTLSGGGGGGES